MNIQSRNNLSDTIAFKALPNAHIIEETMGKFKNSIIKIKPDEFLQPQNIQDKLRIHFPLCDITVKQNDQNIKGVNAVCSKMYENFAIKKPKLELLLSFNKLDTKNHYSIAEFVRNIMHETCHAFNEVINAPFFNFRNEIKGKNLSIKKFNNGRSDLEYNMRLATDTVRSKGNELLKNDKLFDKKLDEITKRTLDLYCIKRVIERKLFYEKLINHFNDEAMAYKIGMEGQVEYLKKVIPNIIPSAPDLDYISPIYENGACFFERQLKKFGEF